MSDTSPNETVSVRERLILAGIEEINASGFQNLSLRRVATACGVSCAAPYKHFKDKPEFFAAIVDYINGLWAARHEAVRKQYPSGPRKQLVEISLEYIRFLVENPHFRSIVMLKDDELDRMKVARGGISEESQRLISAYCRSVGMPEKTERLKTYIVRSLIYGAALMFDNGELAYNEENMSLAAYAIEREFDLV